MKKLVLLFAKGVAMGAADVVPGVSGGTIAFVTGIYDELLKSIASLPRAGIATLRGRFAEAWKAANGWFLPVLLTGIVCSLVTLAKLVTYLLESHPIPMWSFMFGLVLVSCFLVVRQVTEWRATTVAGLAAGALLGWWITVASPIEWGTDYPSLFFAGAIAISAMILPGLSGSFILLLLGLYPFILAAIHTFQFGVLAVFASGCAFGLLAFAHVLRWMLARWRNVALATLTGIMLGSLNKVWPWSVPLAGSDIATRNVLPWTYADLSGYESQWAAAVTAAVCGFLIVVIIDRVARSQPTHGQIAQ